MENRDSGLVAVVSRNNLDKMLSESAVAKSASAMEHAQAVANLDYLYQNATYGWAKEDRNSDTNIRAVHRLFAPMQTQNEDGIRVVKLTTKELGEKDGNRIYSVEAVKIEKECSTSIWVAANLKHDGLESISTPYAEHVESLAKAVQTYNDEPYPMRNEPEVMVHFQREMSLKLKNSRARSVWVDHSEDG
ncbi:MAG: hypothetical protein LBQ81_00910, partial [Zoogloeaceae bacterium]|nr:hypothetical protein [Zoogloeaceae bacterium]